MTNNTCSADSIVQSVIFPDPDVYVRIDNIYNNVIQVTVYDRNVDTIVQSAQFTVSEWDDTLRNYCISYNAEREAAAADMSV